MATLAEWRAAAVANPGGFVQKKLRLPDKMGQDVKFTYNWAQRKVSHIKAEARKNSKAPRIQLLKWRRAGISIEESGENYAYAYGHDNARAAILAHLEDRAKELLDNYKYFDQAIKDHYPEIYIPKTKDNIFGIKFARTNGQVLIGTAENPIKVRGDGIHRLHLSEWCHFYAKFKKVMEEVCPVVPVHWLSLILMESTGSLRGSAPHQHWEEKNEFEKHFLNWLDSPDEVIVLPSRRDYEELYETIYQHEPRLAEKNKYYKLSPEKIAMSWQMYHFQSNNDFDYFCREFPYTVDEAWSSGGSSYFGVYELGKAKPEHPEAIYLFEHHNICKIFPDFSELKRVDNVGDYGTFPYLKIFKFPVKGRRYVMGSDSASGAFEGDPSAGCLIDLETREEMVTYHGKLRPDEAAHINVSLARIYNNCLLAPETNPAGGGMEALNVIQRLGYHNIYQWRVRDGIEGVRGNTKLGWWTHSRSRPIMLMELRKMFLDCVNGRIPDPGMFRDISTLNEMRTFGVDPATGIPEAAFGCHDDRVIAKAIAHQVASDEVYCTSKDLLYSHHKFDQGPKQPLDQEALVSRRQTPDQVLKAFLDPRSRFNRNKWEFKQ